MEALTISEANLNALEDNLAELTKGLNAVMANMDNMNNAVNVMENKVGGIDNGLQSVLEEIKSNTILNNARQNIMFNNSIIEKKFGYYDKLRRNVESLIEAVENNSIEKSSLTNLKDNIMMNNPRYWLSNATVALIYWLLDDKERCNKEIVNALRKETYKTSLFFLITNLKLNRKATAIRWLRYYLNRIDPNNINNDFVTVLDLVANGYLGLDGEKILIDKINNWILKMNNNIKEKQISKWGEIIDSSKKETFEFNIISKFSNNNTIINNNLSIMSSYINSLNDIDDLLNKENKKIDIEEVLYNLIYDYEDVEQQYREENIKNELIIKTNGNKEEADKIYNQKIVEVLNKTNILDLLFDITNHKEKYDLCNNAIKIAFVFQKEYLIKAYEKTNSKLKKTELVVEYEDFKTSSMDGKNIEEVKKDISTYVDSKYKSEDRSTIIILIIINIIGLFAIIMSKDISILNLSILAIIVFINISLILKLNKNTRLLEREKALKKKNIEDLVEKAFAEITDYSDFINKNNEAYQTLISRMDKINIENIISNTDRRINTGE